MFGHGEPDPFDRIRQTIAAIGDQRSAAAANTGAALVNQAQVERALRDQMAQLVRVREQITDALATAERAAAGARADDGELAAAPYEQTADGLRSALDVVGASFAQLDGLHDVSQTNIQQARELVAAARRTLDTALRDQVKLLLRLERVHREHLLEQARGRRARRRP